MQGVCAGEVSRIVALHLTSILITPFQQRSCSQTLPQSNGLTWEASLHWRASLPPLLALQHAHTHTRTHTKCSLISPLSGRIRWKQISSAPVTSSGTVLLLRGRYHLVSSTSTSTPQQITQKKKKKNTLSLPPLSLFLSCSLTLFFNTGG